MMFLQVVTFASVCLLLLPVSNVLGRNLYFGLMIGEHDDGGAKMGVDDALISISRMNLLPSHYTLSYIELQVKCNRTVALNEVFTNIFHSPNHDSVVAIVGAGCSLTTEATAEISHYYNITQISCASSSDELNDRVRFPYYFQLLPSEVNLARVFYSIIKGYKWRRVALIVQNEHRYRRMAGHLKDLSKGVIYTIKVMDDNDLNDDMDESLFDSQMRIFVIFADSQHARRVICEAYHMGFKYPKYLFLTYGSYESHWWATNDSQIKCTPMEMAKVLQFSLAALHFPSPSDEMESANMAQPENQPRIRHRVVSNQLEVYHQCYDATLALARAIGGIIEDIPGTTITNDNNAFAQRMKAYLQATTFDGISGSFHFDENGIRNVAELRVLQYRTTYIDGTPLDDDINNATLDLVEVAYVRGNESVLEFLDDNYSIWPSYIIPHDGVPESKPSTVILPVTVVVILLNSGGLAFAFFCLMFNITYRKKKLIRLSSPNLNYLTIAGTILLYCSASSFAVPTTSPEIVASLCFSRMWLLTFGYFCGFGAIVAKLWRIYYIFRNPKAKSSGIKDWYLIVFVLTLLLISMVGMCVHITLEGVIAGFNVAEIPNTEMPDGIKGEQEIPLKFYTYECSSHLWIRYSMQTVIIFSAVILLLCALYLAFQTRKVKVKGLNDAKHIAIVVCFITMAIFATVILTFTLSSNNLTTYIVIYGIGIWISATIILVIMFVPKVVSLSKDPEGKRIFNAHVETLQGTTALGRLMNDDLLTMKRKLKRMENVTEEYKRMTGLDLLPKNQLTTSMSMMNLSANNGNNLTDELRTLLRQRCKK